MATKAETALQIQHLERLLGQRGSHLTVTAPNAKITAAQRAHYEAAIAEQLLTPKDLATALLMSLLDRAQQATFTERQEFTTLGSNGKRYLIRLGRQHNVFELDENGTAVVEICGHVRDNIPNEDNMAAQKLALETDADLFLRTANSFNISTRRLIIQAA